MDFVIVVNGSAKRHISTQKIYKTNERVCVSLSAFFFVCVCTCMYKYILGMYTHYTYYFFLQQSNLGHSWKVASMGRLMLIYNTINMMALHWQHTMNDTLFISTQFPNSQALTHLPGQIYGIISFSERIVEYNASKCASLLSLFTSCWGRGGAKCARKPAHKAASTNGFQQ